jgi:nucleoside-diphosphate kinase
LGLSGGFNLIHGSDGPESAARELALWFTPAELLEYTPAREQWTYDPSDL